MPNLSPVPLSDIVFLMTGGTLTIHIGCMDVAEAVLERNERLVRLMIERNANLPSTRSKPSSFIKLTSRRDSVVGYKPVSVVGGEKHPFVGIGIEILKIVCRESQMVKFLRCGLVQGVSVGITYISDSESWSSPFFLLCSVHLFRCTCLLPNYYLKTELLWQLTQ